MTTTTAIERMEERTKELEKAIRERLAELDAERAELLARIGNADHAADEAVLAEDEDAYFAARQDAIDAERKLSFLDRKSKQITQGPLITREEYEKAREDVLQEMAAYHAAAGEALEQISETVNALCDDYSEKLDRTEAALRSWRRDVFRNDDLPKSKDGKPVVIRQSMWEDHSVVVALERIKAAIDGYRRAHP